MIDMGIKKIHGEMLDAFIEVCLKYNLKWFLAYGTLLGAVREGKFIDWDHDVDLWMPYEDYKKLDELNSDHKIFCDDIKLIGYDGANKDCRNFKVTKHGTTMRLYGKPACRVFMDIYPIIDIEDEPDELEKLISLSAAFRETYELSCKTKAKKDLKWLIIDFEHASNNMKKDNNVVSICIEDAVGYYYSKKEAIRDRFLRKRLPQLNFNSFELRSIANVNHPVRIPKNYHDVLKVLYGNYMVPKKIQENKWTVELDQDVQEYFK